MQQTEELPDQYTHCDVGHMSGEQIKTLNRIGRMKKELDELQVRVRCLTAFIGTPKYDTLDTEEQSRLCEQHEHMAGYRNVLSARIAAAEGES